MTLRGFAPKQLESLSVDPSVPSRWDGTGWTYEGARNGTNGEWQIRAISVDQTPAQNLDMRFDARFSADEVAGMIAEQIGWVETEPPPDDRTDYALLEQQRIDAERAEIRAEILKP